MREMLVAARATQRGFHTQPASSQCPPQRGQGLDTPNRRRRNGYKEWCSGASGTKPGHTATICEHPHTPTDALPQAISVSIVCARARKLVVLLVLQNNSPQLLYPNATCATNRLLPVHEDKELRKQANLWRTAPRSPSQASRTDCRGFGRV